MPIVPFDVSNWFRHEVDGGWAWIVVSASFIIQMILFGIIQSYGTMFVALLNDFKSGEYETGKSFSYFVMHKSLFYSNTANVFVRFDSCHP